MLSVLIKDNAALYYDIQSRQRWLGLLISLTTMTISFCNNLILMQTSKVVINAVSVQNVDTLMSVKRKDNLSITPNVAIFLTLTFLVEQKAIYSLYDIQQKCHTINKF